MKAAIAAFFVPSTLIIMKNTRILINIIFVFFPLGRVGIGKMQTTSISKYNILSAKLK
jgi:hypothetical protein